MIDTETRKPIQVLSGGEAGPYIRVRLEQLDQVRKLLEGNNIRHWVDSFAISIDGRPPVVVIDLDKKVDPCHVQAILDDA